MSFFLPGPAGRLESSLEGNAEPELRAVVAHPHPLYGGTMENLVVLTAQVALLDADAEVLRFNFRGVGRSEGLHDRGDGERHDLQCAFDFLRLRQPHRQSIIAGYSFGAAMALAVLALEDQLPPDGLLLLAPPLTHYDFSALDRSSLPTAMIYGERDDLTPPQMVTDCTDGRAAPTLVEALPAARHDLGSASDSGALRLALGTSIRWLCRQMEQH